MLINLVTEQDIKELERKVSVADKNDKNYSILESNLIQARERFEFQKKIIKKAGKKGYRPNPIDGDCSATGERIKANCGFTKKDQFGRWEVYSWDIVKEEIEN